MEIANVRINRVIAHEVVRASQLTERPPVLSARLVTIDPAGQELLAKRIVSTVASGSHCVDIAADDASVGSPFFHATNMLDHNDADFIGSSRHLATALSGAQTTGTIKSGSAVFIQGLCAADNRDSRFLAIIKADSDQGFYREVNGENVTLRYVNDMLLGESQRLIKIAFFIETEHLDGRAASAPRQPEEFSIKVFDHMMQNSGDGNAAVYFYGTFLKCQLAHNASRQTKQFYELARAYIDEMEVPQEERVALRGDLISHLRGNRTTLQPRTFAREVLPQEHQNAFVGKCRDAGITQAVPKDLTLLKGKLRRQSIRFSSKVTISASPETLKESVKIVRQTNDGWTELRIQGTIEEMR